MECTLLLSATPFQFHVIFPGRHLCTCLLSSNGEGLLPGSQNMEACFLLVNFRKGMSLSLEQTLVGKSVA